MKLQVLRFIARRWAKLPPGLGLGVALGIVSLAKPCLAERVVLVRPMASAPVLSEVFNRLQGELRMHGFETILASASGLPSAGEMQRVAELGQADASVALERAELELTAHVWFLDRETGQVRVLSIAVLESEETPTILALRTVELLRSSLREQSSRRVQQGKGTPKGPTQLPAAATSAREGSAPSRRNDQTSAEARVALRVEGALVWNTPQQAALLAPALSLGYRVLPGWALAARLVWPISVNRIRTTGATADVRFAYALAESRWSVSSGERRIAVEPLVALGVARCSASGRGEFPIAGLEASSWTVAAALGLGAWFTPSERWSVGSTFRAGALLPKPVVRVSQRDEVYGRPWLELSLGLTYLL